MRAIRHPSCSFLFTFRFLFHRRQFRPDLAARTSAPISTGVIFGVTRRKKSYAFGADVPSGILITIV